MVIQEKGKSAIERERERDSPSMRHKILWLQAFSCQRISEGELNATNAQATTSHISYSPATRISGNERLYPSNTKNQSRKQPFHVK